MTDRLQHIESDTLPPAVGYMQAVIVPAGRIALISGQVGVDRNWLLASDFEAQTDRAFANLANAVQACGATLADVAKLNVYVCPGSDLAVYCAVRDRWFVGQTRMPASTYVQVAGLYTDAALIEIEATVALPPT
jgi:enamine deaminase RidA (YjgF/YER057c/UK114 family)